MIYHDALNIFTDGSSYQGPRRGGVGFLFIHLDKKGNEIIEERQPFGYRGASNNQMELQAAILALKEVPTIEYSYRVSRIVIFSDSRYVTENYLRAIKWSQSKWLKSGGAPVANALQWKELLKIIKELRMRVSFEWVKGHAKNENNKKVDKLAKQSAKGLLNKPLVYTDLRRKTSDKMTKAGSVVLKGQKLKIRIVTIEYQRLQKVFKIRYEVVSKKSEFFNCLDFAFSNIALRTAHTYYVKFNDDSRNPRILDMIREIIKKPKKKTGEEE